MDPELRAYLLRVLYSLTAGLVWIFFNMTVGIYMGWMFFEGRMKTGNIIFYFLLVLTLTLLILYLLKLWRKKTP